MIQREELSTVLALHEPAGEGGLALLWLSALVTLYTGYDYFRAGLKHIMDE